MKTIGLIGGVSWESSAEYYRIINREIGRRLGGLSSGRIILYSFNFTEIEPLQREGRDDEVTAALVHACRVCENGGADLVLICSNTTNKNADEVAAQLRIPLLHITDVTAEAIKALGMNKVALLGTKYTMEQDFYKGRLERKHGLSVLVPEEADRKLVNRVIYEELCRGIVREESRREYQRIIRQLAGQGAEGVVLGCTEIPMLIQQQHSPIPVFDTTELHAMKAVELALA